MRMSIQQSDPPAPTALPRPPVSVTTIGTDGQATTITLPRTRAEIDELLTQREELAEQLNGVSARRRNLAEEIFDTRDATVRAGLEDRLRLLDSRILQLETDLATTGRQLSGAPAELIVARESIAQSGEGGFEEGLMIGGFTVLFALGLAFLFFRRRWKRFVPRGRDQLGADAGARLERLEHGMDAIAIEIERVSEGQRFVTRLLSEAQPPVSAARLGEPVGVKPDTANRR
jgi:hypothetical protein